MWCTSWGPGVCASNPDVGKHQVSFLQPGLGHQPNREGQTQGWPYDPPRSATTRSHPLPRTQFSLHPSCCSCSKCLVTPVSACQAVLSPSATHADALGHQYAGTGTSISMQGLLQLWRHSGPCGCSMLGSEQRNAPPKVVELPCICSQDHLLSSSSTENLA